MGGSGGALYKGYCWKQHAYHEAPVIQARAGLDSGVMRLGNARDQRQAYATASHRNSRYAMKALEDGIARFSGDAWAIIGDLQEDRGCLLGRRAWHMAAAHQHAAALGGV